MFDFAKTRMGSRLFEGVLPAMVRALERIADALEEANAREKEKDVKGDKK